MCFCCDGKPSAGIYGFGNSAREKPFRKITYGLKLFEEKLEFLNHKDANEQLLCAQFLQILTDTTRMKLPITESVLQPEKEAQHSYFFHMSSFTAFC
ncbi:unnamed protein product [Gongylonema pulchrum]|uniref:Uncharacterized protein n=1 Tax=Gongylonema pulchrum TaxID=637853 RepID=A0A183DGS8_9BILA|nr:unnamed protein product [Gongylonema pulchrum]